LTGKWKSLTAKMNAVTIFSGIFSALFSYTAGALEAGQFLPARQFLQAVEKIAGFLFQVEC